MLIVYIIAVDICWYYVTVYMRTRVGSLYMLTFRIGMEFYIVLLYPYKLCAIRNIVRRRRYFVLWLRFILYGVVRTLSEYARK